RETVDPVPAGQLAVLAVSSEASTHPFPEGKHVHAGEQVTVAGGGSGEPRSRRRGTPGRAGGRAPPGPHPNWRMTTPTVAERVAHCSVQVPMHDAGSCAHGSGGPCVPQVVRARAARKTADGRIEGISPHSRRSRSRRG